MCLHIRSIRSTAPMVRESLKCVFHLNFMAESTNVAAMQSCANEESSAVVMIEIARGWHRAVSPSSYRRQAERVVMDWELITYPCILIYREKTINRWFWKRKRPPATKAYQPVQNEDSPPEPSPFLDFCPCRLRTRISQMEPGVELTYTWPHEIGLCYRA